MFEATVIKLLEGAFICRTAYPDLFSFLEDESTRRQVDGYLTQIGRRLAAADVLAGPAHRAAVRRPRAARLTRAAARPAAALEVPPAVEPITARPQSEALPLDPPPAAAGVPVVDGWPDRRALAAELREQDWSNKAIARHLGVHPSTVGRWLPRAHQSDEADPSGSQPEMEGALP